MDLSDARVLVTGGTGFIGGRLVERLMLEHGAHVRVLVRSFQHAVRVARFPVEFCTGSVTDQAALTAAADGCDVIFHCAHDPSARIGQRPADVVAAENVVRATRAHGPGRVVCLSSLVVYGPTPDGDLTEAAPWRPIRNAYVAAKRDSEQILRRAHREHQVPVVILQPTAVYGPYGKVWTTVQVRDMHTGLIPLVDGGGGYCNSVYVDDVVDAMLLAATQPGVEGEPFLVSGREPITWKAFYAALEDIIGANRTVEVSRAELARLARLQRRRSRRRAVQWTRSSVRRWLLDPETVSTIRELAIAQRGADLLSRTLPEDRWAALKQRLAGRGGGGQAGVSPRDDAPPVHIPNKMLLALYTSRTRVRIDKAQQRLGYQPRFEFDRGMALTAAYLRWAELI